MFTPWSASNVEQLQTRVNAWAPSRQSVLPAVRSKGLMWPASSLKEAWRATGWDFRAGTIRATARFAHAPRTIAAHARRRCRVLIR